MSDLNAAPIEETTQNIGANLDNVPTVPETAKAIQGAINLKVIGVAITIVVTVVVVVTVTTLVALAVTHKGPFSAATSSSSSISTVVASATTTATTIAAPSQCSSYTTINDVTRLQTAAGGSACDSSLFSASITWVRFSGAGGTQLATSAPGMNQCGTQATGWYSSSLPLSGATVNGTVCFQWNSNNCNWSNTILVINCGSFYLFGLISPPVCNACYCTQ